MKDSNRTHQVLMEIAAERGVQRGRWGNDHDDTHTVSSWVRVLSAYFGHVAVEAFSVEQPRPTEEAELRYVPQGNLRSLLVKLAATAVAWVEAIDRRSRREAGFDA